jgi:geranylgeranyl diphosphate synthase type II
MPKDYWRTNVSDIEVFEQALKDRAPRVYEKIAEYLREYAPEKFPKEHYKMVRDYSDRRGKYLRPVLIILGSEMLGGKEKEALLTAAAMQTSEDWILIHDDIEDHSEKRRGKPALPKVLGMNNIPYGDELALNAGDALHMIMWKMLFDNVNVLGLQKTKKLFNLMEDILLYTCEGQYLDISWTHYGSVYVTEEEYYKMIDAKAGAYTVYGPIQLGAVVASATEEQIDSIKEWGLPFGRAFMIHDDVLNLTGTEDKYGKEIGGDILEGKRTLMFIHLLRHCSEEERDKVIEIYLKTRQEKEKEGSKHIKYVIDLMKKYGSIDFAQTKATEFAEEAKRLFDKRTKSLRNTYARNVVRAGIVWAATRDR